MANVYKVLGQAAPSATTDTDVYTVPSATEAVISTIFICNRDDTSSTYDIAIRPAGAALSNQHYIAKNVSVGASDSTTITSGITMSATDILTVYASSSNLSFSVFGSEIS